MSAYIALTETQRRYGWLVSYTREDGRVEIALTDVEAKNQLLRHWATGNGAFRTEEYTAAGERLPAQGDAWEAPAVPWETWVS